MRAQRSDFLLPLNAFFHGEDPDRTTIAQQTLLCLRNMDRHVGNRNLALDVEEFEQ